MWIFGNVKGKSFKSRTDKKEQQTIRTIDREFLTKRNQELIDNGYSGLDVESGVDNYNTNSQKTFKDHLQERNDLLIANGYPGFDVEQESKIGEIL